MLKWKWLVSYGVYQSIMLYSVYYPKQFVKLDNLLFGKLKDFNHATDLPISPEKFSQESSDIFEKFNMTPEIVIVPDVIIGSPCSLGTSENGIVYFPQSFLIGTEENGIEKYNSFKKLSGLGITKTCPTKEERDFVLAHEMSHLKCNHLLKSAKFTPIVSIAPMAITDILYNKCIKKKILTNNSGILKKSVFTIFRLGLIYTNYYLSDIILHNNYRNDEKEADLMATSILKTSDGGIKFVKNVHEQNITSVENYYKHFKFSPEKLKNKMESLQTVEYTHPSYNKRLFYLEEYNCEE